MGLFLSLAAEKPKRRFSGFFSKQSNWAHLIRDNAFDLARERGLGALIPLEQPEPDTGFVVMYCEEMIDIVEDAETVRLSARTTSCGPGYLSFLCYVTVRMAKKHGLVFKPLEMDDTVLEYFERGNFSDLQLAHAQWLGELFGTVSEIKGQHTSIALSMRRGVISPLLDLGVVATPLGLRDPAYFTTIDTDDDDKLLLAAGDWFPWWNREMSGDDWHKMGLALLWGFVRWHVPIDERQRHVCEAALFAFSEAKRLGSARTLLIEALAELRKLCADDADPEIAPEPDGIGYFRRPCVWSLNSWRVIAPGYWYDIVEEDSFRLVFGTKVIWISEMTVGTKDGSPPTELVLTRQNMADEPIDQYEIDEVRYMLEKDTVNKDSQEHIYWGTVTSRCTKMVFP